MFIGALDDDLKPGNPRQTRFLIGLTNKVFIRRLRKPIDMQND
jgi:hypothetical protein